MAYLQSWSLDGLGDSMTTATLIVDGASANNLLVAIVAIRNRNTTFTTPGWTEISSGADGVGSVATYYRIATGNSSDNFAPVWGGSARYKLIASEFSGLDSTPIIEASDFTNRLDAPAGVGSISTGTATNTTDNGTAVAYLGVGSDFENPTIDNGFSITESLSANGFRPGAAIAYIDYSAISAKQATWTRDPASVDAEAFAAIALFKSAGAAGPPTGSGSIDGVGTLEGVGSNSPGIDIPLGMGMIIGIGVLAGQGSAPVVGGASGSGEIDAVGTLEGVGLTPVVPSAGGSGQIEGIGVLSGQGFAPIVGGAAGSGSIDSVGVLTGSGKAITSGSGEITAIGLLIGAGRSPVVGEKTGFGSIVGVGTLAGSGRLVAQGSGQIDSIGVLLGLGQTPGKIIQYQEFLTVQPIIRTIAVQQVTRSIKVQ